MSGEFKGLRAKRYEFREHDGRSRPVIAIYAGAKPMGFIEFGTTARKFVDQVHDLCDEHDREGRKTP